MDDDVPDDADADDGLAITPFKPDEGIWFKTGTVFRDKAAEVAAFESAAGVSLPADFWEMIGENCEGGFRLWYRVFCDGATEVNWTNLCLMRLPSTERDYGARPIELVGERPGLFNGPEGQLRLFPFGKAFSNFGENQSKKGYLAFVLDRGRSIVFLSDDGQQTIRVADSFRAMMLKSHLCFA